MGHNTSALIGRLPVKLDKIEFYGLAVAFEENYAIVFLDEDHLFHWFKKLSLKYFSENSKLQYGNELVMYFAKEIGLEDYVITYLSDTFYGEFYKNSVKTSEGHINLMLEKIGVEVYNSLNEFHQLNLDEYRMSECYYWDEKINWAKLKENIIAGRIDK